MALSRTDTAQAVLRAHRERDARKMLLIAWFRCGSWDVALICQELEDLARIAWGDRWEWLLTDLRLHTVANVRLMISAAQQYATAVRTEMGDG